MSDSYINKDAVLLKVVRHYVWNWQKSVKVVCPVDWENFIFRIYMYSHVKFPFSFEFVSVLIQQKRIWWLVTNMSCIVLICFSDSAWYSWRRTDTGFIVLGPENVHHSTDMQAPGDMQTPGEFLVELYF